MVERWWKSVKETMNAQEQKQESPYIKEVTKFLTETPSYYPCPDNFQALRKFCGRHDLEPTAHNLKYAFDCLTSVDMLKTKEAKDVKEKR